MLVELEPMAELHERWLDEPGPTDVMSFPMDEYDSARRPDAPSSGPALLGDIVLCPAFAADQAATAGHGLDDELHLLTVHGVLHLLGYDHAEPDEERAMFGLQAELLADWRTQRAAAARVRRRERRRGRPPAGHRRPRGRRRRRRVAVTGSLVGQLVAAILLVPWPGCSPRPTPPCRRCPAPASTPWSARGATGREGARRGRRRPSAPPQPAPAAAAGLRGHRRGARRRSSRCS